MLRHVYLVAVIYALLICPIRCIGGGEVAHAGESVSTGCACCRHSVLPTDTEGHQAPQQSDDCQCGSCLCHGATRVDSVPPIDHEAVSELIHFRIELVDACACPDMECVEFPDGWDLRRLSGKSLRICYSSLLC